jgi:hypothetical protein
MVSRETAPSLLRIVNRVTSMLQDQKRKIRSRMVTLGPQEAVFQRLPPTVPAVVRTTSLRHGKIRITGDLSIQWRNFVSSNRLNTSDVEISFGLIYFVLWGLGHLKSVIYLKLRFLCLLLALT